MWRALHSRDRCMFLNQISFSFGTHNPTMSASLVVRCDRVVGRVMCAYFQAGSWLLGPSPHPNLLSFLQLDVKDSKAPKDRGLVRL